MISFKLNVFTWLSLSCFFMIVEQIKSQDSAFNHNENQKVLQYLFESNPSDLVKNELLSFTDKKWSGISQECGKQFSYFTSSLKKREPWALTGWHN